MTHGVGLQVQFEEFKSCSALLVIYRLSIIDDIFFVIKNGEALRKYTESNKK
jgi:hypothetical protein